MGNGSGDRAEEGGIGHLHRVRLQQERDRLARQLDALERSLEELVARVDLEPPDDEHDPDGVTAYERAQLRSLVAETRVRIEQTDEALAASDGELAVCRACGSHIGAERLDALPATTRCVACAGAGR